MSDEFFLLLLVAALCFAIIAVAVLIALVLASRTLAQALMGLLTQLYGSDACAEARSGATRKLGEHAGPSESS